MPERAASAAIPGVLTLFLLSCTTSRLSDSFLEEGYRASRSTPVQYRAPTGWLEVPPEEWTSDVELWLVSPEFQQSMEMRLITLDGGGGEELMPESVARLRAGSLHDEGQTVVDSLYALIEGDRTFWSYSSSNTAGVLQCVSLFVAGNKYLEARMLLRSRADAERMSVLYREFLGALRW